MQPRSSTRFVLIGVILLLAGMLVVLLWNLAPLISAEGSAGPRQRVVRSSVTSAVPLPDAYARAEARVRQWSQDAYPVRIEAAWYLSDGWDHAESPPVAWTFSYFSPSAASLAVVVIDDESTLWVPPFEIPVTPASLGTALPAQGPEVAWLSYRAADGDAFLRIHPESQVSFRLQQSQGKPTWTVSAFDGSDFASISMDAQSGLVSTGLSSINER